MSNEDKGKLAERNKAQPPFTFRFASRRIKLGIKQLAKRNHRTIAGEINALCEAILGGAK